MIAITEGAAISANPGLFLQTLKTSTSALHELLESNSLLSAIISSNVTVKQYHCYLILMKKVEEIYEQNVLPLLLGVVKSFEQIKASELIADDIKDIGYDLPAGIKLIEFDVPKDMTVPFALGFMYVMEGSKLGGKVIFKHIQSTLGFSEDCGAKFIADYGSNTGRKWKEFLSMFSLYITDNGGEEEAIKGAKFAFSSIYGFFEANHLVYDN